MTLLKFIVAVLISIFTAGYMLPWAMAWVRNHKNTTAIFILNLLLGWTVVGWVVSIVWAVMKD